MEYKKRRIFETAPVIMGFKCNNNCLFCYERCRRRLPEKTTAELKKEIFVAAKKGFWEVHFIGGEPTIRPDILELIEYARDSGFDSVEITSNGRMFAYPDFANKIVKSGISLIVISLHGHNAELHDRLTRARGSFSQVMAGLKNFKKMGFENIGINTVIVNQNYRYLPAIAKILAKYRIKRVNFIYVEAPEKGLESIKPRISLAAPYIRDAFKIGQGSNYLCRLQDAPMGCYFKEYFKYLTCCKEEKNTSLVDSRKNRLYKKMENRNSPVYLKPKECLPCYYYNQCLGVKKLYLREFGGKEIRPILKKEII